MLTISLTLVVLFSAIVLLHQFATGALTAGDERQVEQPPEPREEAPAARAA